ncbi:MAG: hypothetical protein WBI41_10875 [Azovibrio sp.]|uniref:hypothetical protein n=1 Tax=Azovibrio sp. TaxID=1872673 RepID=UPI003C74AE86
MSEAIRQNFLQAACRYLFGPGAPAPAKFQAPAPASAYSQPQSRGHLMSAC